MGDFTKAGLDRGDLEKELENTLIGARFIYQSYLANIDDLTEEELRQDLEEYKDQIKRSIISLVKRAEATRDKRLVNMAYEIRYTYEKLVEAIQERLSTF